MWLRANPGIAIFHFISKLVCIIPLQYIPYMMLRSEDISHGLSICWNYGDEAGTVPIMGDEILYAQSYGA